MQSYYEFYFDIVDGYCILLCCINIHISILGYICPRFFTQFDCNVVTQNILSYMTFLENQNDENVLSRCLKTFINADRKRERERDIFKLVRFIHITN